MSDPKILRKATFDKTVCSYWLLAGTISLIICVVTIPLLPFWWIFGLKVTRKYLDLMSCTLTEKTLIVKKGWLNRIEKTIPLEKITDLALRQGPIMRAMNLKALSVETAGSSGGAAGGALVALVGIEDTVGFRDSVLAQRDLLASNAATPSSAPPTDESTLVEIRDTLHRIEQSMKVTS